MTFVLELETRVVLGIKGRKRDSARAGSQFDVAEVVKKKAWPGIVLLLLRFVLIKIR